MGGGNRTQRGGFLYAAFNSHPVPKRCFDCVIDVKSRIERESRPEHPVGSWGLLSGYHGSYEVRVRTFIDAHKLLSALVESYVFPRVWSGQLVGWSA